MSRNAFEWFGWAGCSFWAPEGTEDVSQAGCCVVMMMLLSQTLTTTKVTCNLKNKSLLWWEHTYNRRGASSFSVLKTSAIKEEISFVRSRFSSVNGRISHIPMILPGITHIHVILHAQQLPPPLYANTHTENASSFVGWITSSIYITT